MINKFEGRWAFLSNFYPSIIEHQGIKYPTVESFYVAMKVNDQQLINGQYYTIGDFREMIAKIESPGLAKKIGRKVKLRSDWETYKFHIMNLAVREKFKDSKLAKMLIDTGEQELIEVNWWNDVVWGVCNGKGENHLGKILMCVRDELKGVKRTGLEEILK
jgi:ribA/ribD-fused uncharacterized protein